MTEDAKKNVDELTIFELISSSGDARSNLYEAYELVKKENYDEAQKLLDKANESIIKAHSVQTDLIQGEAKGEHLELNLLMVHAQDHLMTTLLAKEIIGKLISMQKEINELKSQIK